MSLKELPVGYENFKRDLFDYFIRYIPENRTQYT